MGALTLFSRAPVSDPISGGFGEWYNPGTPSTYQHRGIDFASYLKPVFCPGLGQVVSFYNDGSFGKAICLDHRVNGPQFSLYAHLSEIRVQPGQWVQAGDILGITGNTGTGNVPHHLHWQLSRTNTFPIDIAQSYNPFDFLEEDLMEPARRALMVYAGGSFEKMCEVYDALTARGFFPGDAGPIDGVNDLNDAEVRRWRILALANTERAAEAFDVIK